MKRIILLSAFLLLLVSCSSRVVTITYTEKFEGLTQLVLASQTTTVNFVEDVSKSLLAVFKSHAKVQVHSNVTFDFYLDFAEDGYKARLDKREKILYFTAPPIRVKKPVINSSTVSFPETGILVNEAKEAIKILEHLTDRFIDEGDALLQEPRIKAMCEEKLTEYLAGLSKELDYDVKTVIITFKEAEVE